MKTRYSQKCILSFRVARELMERGHIPVGTEQARKSDGYSVFIFVETPDFTLDFEKIMRNIAVQNGK